MDELQPILSPSLGFVIVSLVFVLLQVFPVEGRLSTGKAGSVGSSGTGVTTASMFQRVRIRAMHVIHPPLVM
jgi:EamA domain-containing membrane protein RarD